jgi:uncharacterized membrane protein YhaH (DUF805 family)
LPRLIVSDGTIEALKWLALVLMTLDHVNKYLLHGSAPLLFALGRIALPLFAFVLAFNLARPGAVARGTHQRTAARLLFFGALASVPFIALGGLGAGWWPLNIMATLLVATGVIYLVERGGPFRATLAVVLFIVGGGFVEFWWPAIALTVAGWRYVKRPSWPALLAWVLATLALNLNGWAFGAMPLLNASMWALLAFPIIFATPYIELRACRLRYVFYVYFPLHLAVLWALGSLT